MRAWIATVGIVAAMLAAAPLADAKQGGSGAFTVATKSTTITGANTIGYADAVCPTGTRAVGGGYQTSLPGVPEGQLPIVFYSRGAPRVWSVGMANVTAGTTTLTAYAYCRVGRLRVTEVAGTSPLAASPRSEATATATCPKGTRAISGGFFTTGVFNGAFTYLTNFAPAGGRSWTMTATRNGLLPQGGTAPITSYAYCANLEGAGLKKGTDSLNTGPSHVYPAALTRRCGRGHAPTAGGFHAPYVSIGTDREATLVTEQQQVGRRWRVFGIGLGTTGQRLNLTAIALCS